MTSYINLAGIGGGCSVSSRNTSDFILTAAFILTSFGSLPIMFDNVSIIVSSTYKN